MANFCEHCEGQRFDRARVLRALRQLRRELCGTNRTSQAARALGSALSAVKGLDLPHLETDEGPEDEVVH